MGDRQKASEDDDDDEWSFGAQTFDNIRKAFKIDPERYTLVACLFDSRASRQVSHAVGFSLPRHAASVTVHWEACACALRLVPRLAPGRLMAER